MRRFIAFRWFGPDSSGHQTASRTTVSRRGAAARLATACALIGCGIIGPMAASPAAAEEPGTTRNRRETPTVMAIRRCSNAVVNIHGQKTIRSTAASMAGADPGRQVNGMGTGVVIDPRGYVVTNYHVVEDVEEVRITLADGKQTTAEVVATDVRSDLALLKVDVTEPLEVIPRGTSCDLMVGEPVIAIGNAFGYVHTATEGIISALHRDVPVNDTQEYRDLIQTSAGINPGNSGGPLLNIHGEIIGVNVAVRVGAQQIAFAIPIDQAIDIVNKMIAEHNEERLGLGLSVEGGPRADDGVVISQVSASGSAARDGLKQGDRIIRVGSEPTEDRLRFGLAMIEAPVGGRLPIVVERDGEQMELAVTLEPPVSIGDDVQSLAWSVIGIKVQPVSKTAMQRISAKTKTPYRGGLYVTEVRKGSPAEEKYLNVGDILIGLHGFSTASLPELRAILMEASKDQTQGKFVIIRSDKAMFGYLGPDDSTRNAKTSAAARR
jgi:serine protease Do